MGNRMSHMWDIVASGRRNAMANFRMRLARKLAQLRGDRSQLQYSREVGLSKSTLSRLELGTQNLTLDSLETLCSKLGCDIVDLFTPESDARGSGARRRQ